MIMCKKKSEEQEENENSEESEGKEEGRERDRVWINQGARQKTRFKKK
jgi:hypothetical protein